MVFLLIVFFSTPLRIHELVCLTWHGHHPNRRCDMTNWLNYVRHCNLPISFLRNANTPEVFSQCANVIIIWLRACVCAFVAEPKYTPFLSLYITCVSTIASTICLFNLAMLYPRLGKVIGTFERAVEHPMRRDETPI